MKNKPLRIAFAGANGHICRELIKKFEEDEVLKNCELFPITRVECDLTYEKDVQRFRDKHGPFDVVINGAVINARGKDKKRWSDIQSNLTIYNNIDQILNPALMFDFNSGAAMCDIGSHDPYSIYKEMTLRNTIRNHCGINCQGLSAGNRSHYSMPTLKYAFVIYGLVGELEDDDRFFKSIIRKTLNGEETETSKMVMSFAYIDDIFKSIRNIIFCCFHYHYYDTLQGTKYSDHNFNFKNLISNGVLREPFLSNIIFPSNIYDNLWRLDIHIKQSLKEQGFIEGDIRGSKEAGSRENEWKQYFFNESRFTEKYLYDDDLYKKCIQERIRQIEISKSKENENYESLSMDTYWNLEDSLFKRILGLSGDKLTTLDEICYNMATHIIEEKNGK